MTTDPRRAADDDALRIPIKMLEGFYYPPDTPEQAVRNAEIRAEVDRWVEQQQNAASAADELARETGEGVYETAKPARPEDVAHALLVAENAIQAVHDAAFLDGFVKGQRETLEGAERAALVAEVTQLREENARLRKPPRLTADECDATPDGHEFTDSCDYCGVDAHEWFNRK